MNIAEMKVEIFGLLAETQNKNTVAEFLRAIHLIIEDEKDWWDELSPSQQADMREGIAQTYDPSKLTPHEEVVKMSRQWIEE